MESKEEQWRLLYEKAASICGIYNQQLYFEYRKNIELEEKNRALDKGMAYSECYAVNINIMNGKNSHASAEARMKCLSCGELDLKPISNYCPNCGRKFKS